MVKTAGGRRVGRVGPVGRVGRVGVMEEGGHQAEASVAEGALVSMRLRSVGIAARLDSKEKAEMFAGVKWHPSPRLVVLRL